jgi:hypothetical protein
MLPFLDKKKIVSVISAKRGKPDVEVNSEMEAPGSELSPGLKEAAEDLMRGLEAKSPIDIAKALKAAFEICDAYPHKEGEHMDEESA